MRRVFLFAALMSTATLSVVISGYQNQAAPQAKLPGVTKIKDNLYIIEAASPVDRSMFTGGNTGLFITSTGVVVVDTKLPNYGAGILERIKTVTNKPVTTIINTHTHGDHTGSNEGFPVSVEIVTHENTKTNMETMDAFKGDKAKFLPRKTYKDKLSLFSGNDRVDLYHFGAGHTNGDTFIVFPALRVVQAGDMFPWKYAPFIDRGNGGSGVELPRSLSKAVSALKGVADTVIPGHIPVTTMSAMEEFQRYTADLLAETQAAIKAGKSVEDAAKSSGVTAKYAGYTSERLQAAIQAIYDELKR